RRYEPGDLDFATELADRAGLAFDNARRHEATRHEVELRQHAEDWMRRRYAQLAAVYRTTDAVARAERLEDVYEEAISGLCAAVGCERAAVLLFDADGVIRFKAARGLTERYRRAVEGHSPWTLDTTEAQTIVIADVAAEP